jgi:hypothetical protein
LTHSYNSICQNPPPTKTKMTAITRRKIKSLLKPKLPNN